jgi:transposase-like protein
MEEVEMDLANLVALWSDSSLRTSEVARRMGVTERHLLAVASRNGLGRRAGPRKKKAGRDDGTEMTDRDPTPAEIERMKDELWKRKLAKLRQETPQETAERILRETLQLTED